MGGGAIDEHLRFLLLELFRLALGESRTIR
jgi:hypothetical protein